MVGVKKKNRGSKDSANQCSHGKMPSLRSSPRLARPTQPCFFKIMLGDFREVLFIPPKFADKLVGLVNQNVYLEDFHGNSSSVEVSMVDGSLAFQEGWQDFVLDHSIGIGEFLVFKYVRRSLFSVQIFGINACERIHFGERNSKNLCTKNRNKADLSLERSQLPKRPKILPAKKDDMSDSDIEITEGDCVVEGALEYGNEPENFPQRYHDSGSPQLVDVMDATGSVVNIISGQATEEPNEKGSSSAEQPKTCHEISFHNQETVETGLHSGHVVRFPLVEENLSSHEDSHAKSKTPPTVACTISETKNQIGRSWDIIPYNSKLKFSPPLDTTEKGLAGEQEKCKIPMISLRGCQTLEDMGASLIESREVVCKFLLTEEGICHIVNDDLENGLGAIISSSELGTSISCNDSVAMSRDASYHHESVPEVNCLGPTADYVEDETSNGVHASEEDGNTPGFLSRKDFSPLVASVGGAVQDLPAIDTTEGNTCQSGIVPDALPEEDEKEDIVCLRSQNLNAVETETMDLDDLSLSNSFCFSLTLSPLVASVGGALQDLPAIDTAEGNTCQSVPDALPEEDVKEDIVCLRSQNLNAVETETMDLDDLSLSNSFCFSLTLSSNTQCWLELPQKLPFHKGKKIHERKIIILQDPSGRLWPALYHESIKFIGLVSGWKDFAMANNLQQGNVCEFFEVDSEFEPTFQVRISQP